MVEESIRINTASVQKGLEPSRNPTMEGLRRPLELSPGSCAFVALNLDGNFLVFALPNTSRI